MAARRISEETTAGFGGAGSARRGPWTKRGRPRDKAPRRTEEIINVVERGAEIRVRTSLAGGRPAEPQAVACPITAIASPETTSNSPSFTRLTRPREPYPRIERQLSRLPSPRSRENARRAAAASSFRRLARRALLPAAVRAKRTEPTTRTRGVTQPELARGGAPSPFAKAVSATTRAPARDTTMALPRGETNTNTNTNTTNLQHTPLSQESVRGRLRVRALA